MKKTVIFLLILFVDMTSKYWVSHHLPLVQTFLGYPFGGIGLLNLSWLKISIVHTTNTGTAWGILADKQLLLLIFRILISLGIYSYLVFLKPPKQIAYAFTCILAGAIGNIIDFFLYGHVIDMFYCIFGSYSYPIFNVADSAIFVAIVYMLFSSGKKNLKHVSS